VRQAEVNAGARPGVTSEEAAEIKRLRREVAELRRANEILKAGLSLSSSLSCGGPPDGRPTVLRAIRVDILRDDARVSDRMAGGVVGPPYARAPEFSGVPPALCRHVDIRTARVPRSWDTPADRRRLPFACSESTQGDL
jgi:hypothetical protein